MKHRIEKSSLWGLKQEYLLQAVITIQWRKSNAKTVSKIYTVSSVYLLERDT
ncbi:hypothetical protein [Photobacterium lipolyticum]|uniref:hypothetical protein n=1 Tax=Photobacterium lipolyticum TaxID=266810 RepID=UPI001472D4D6|nr:hypothetical protein [Photobacterium lipolyticum]